RFGREAEAAVGEDLRVGVADGLVDGLGHDRAAIYLLQVAHRHLAGAEAVELHLVLEVDQLGARLGIEIRCGDADLELVLQSLGEGFGDLHGVNLLPLAPGQSGRQCQMFEAWPCSLPPVVRLTLAPRPGSRPSSIRHANAWIERLVRAEGLEPPQLSSLEPKSSASTSSATPASSIMSGRDAAGGGCITWVESLAAKKWPLGVAGNDWTYRGEIGPHRRWPTRLAEPGVSGR